jgi:HSP90 family molecular chaperone
MTVSRLTIDNLGIKMYDRIPRVLAELISNAYDADATKVTITLPLDQFLSDQAAGRGSGKVITVEDNGVGMTPQELNDHYLRVGANRRTRDDQGVTKLGRRVMGRKGIGKLAPFGVCREIEVVTAGGDKTPQGYLVSHVVLRFEEIQAF